MPSLPVIGAKLKVAGRFTERESAFLTKHADRPFKLTLPSPTMMLVFYREGISDNAYPDRQELIDDVVTIYTREIEALAAGHVPYIQIDSLRYTDLIDPERRAKLDPLGFDRVFAQALAADNALLARAKREGTTRAVHICRGNHRSAWFGRGGYEAVAERLFNELDADRFLLEFDDERSGGFAPLRFVPEGKIVVLGLVTTKSAALESQDELLRRIEEASKFLPLDQLALGPQCGFASTELGNLLGEDDEKRKLELVAGTARRVWG
jgi:5-methyltetrahydropteroyltriglutamate--homocysteine methyltransferase